jgi:hypothetical protein
MCCLRFVFVVLMAFLLQILQRPSDYSLVMAGAAFFQLGAEEKIPIFLHRKRPRAH